MSINFFGRGNVMENWIVDWMEQYGYLGVLLLIAIENVFPPIPSEVILTFGGFMTTYSSMSVFGVVMAATGGSLAGAILLYSIGRLVDAARLQQWVERWGRYLRLKPSDIRRAEAWFQRYGYWAVFLGRMVPLVRSLISLPAGMAHMHFGLFLLLTAIGSFLWNIILVSLGAALGRSWHTVVHFMDVYSNVTYALLGLGLVVLVILWWLRSRSDV